MTRQRKLILTDVDETVLDFANTFQDWCAEQEIKTYGKLRDIYCLEEFTGLTRAECVDLLRTFAESREMLVQPPEACAKVVLPELYALGYDFLAITACGNDPVFRMRRWNTLGSAFGFPWLNVRTVDLHASKRAVLAEYAPAIWVEDNFEHAVVGAELGHRTFLITRAYNANDSHPGVTRVSDWHEIKAILATDQ